MIRSTRIVVIATTTYTAATTRNVTHTPAFSVAASVTVIRLYTIHGWRPTSVTIHPASIVTTERTPAAAAIHRNHRDRGMFRRNSQESANQTESKANSVPRPTMTSHARWTMLTSWIVGA